jgi:hypothetical protein
MSNILFDIEKELPPVTGSFQDVDQTITKNELPKWNNKVETDPTMYNTLKNYWDYVQYGDGWTPSETAWSSAFISYVLQNADFPKRSAHFQYIQDIQKNNFPSWGAYSIPKTERLKLNVGDVLIRPRNTSDYATHGDIVYMIDNGLAYLVGGNVSNTAKIVGTLKVDSDGTLQEPIYNYIVILKKKRNLGMIISVLGVAGLLGLYVLRGRK